MSERSEISRSIELAVIYNRTEDAVTCIHLLAHENGIEATDEGILQVLNVMAVRNEKPMYEMIDVEIANGVLRERGVLEYMME